MRVIITNHHDNMVQVESDIGAFQGVWKSAGPIEHRIYDVELDCDAIITSQSIQSSIEAVPFIAKDNNGIRICGFAEDVDEDILFLRITDSILMLQVDNKCNFLCYIGKYVTINLTCISLYDTGAY